MFKTLIMVQKLVDLENQLSSDIISFIKKDDFMAFPKEGYLKSVTGFKKITPRFYIMEFGSNRDLYSITPFENKCYKKLRRIYNNSVSLLYNNNLIANDFSRPILEVCYCDISASVYEFNKPDNLKNNFLIGAGSAFSNIKVFLTTDELYTNSFENQENKNKIIYNKFGNNKIELRIKVFKNDQLHG